MSQSVDHNACLATKHPIATTSNVQPEIQVLENYKSLFTGTCHLKNFEIHFEINEAVTPVAQPARRILHSMKQVVTTMLKVMRQQEIIEKVESATPWLSPLVVVRKICGDVRLIVDMRKANTALIRSESNILLRTLAKIVNILHFLKA